MDSEEKNRYIHKKKPKKQGLSKNFKAIHLREKDDDASITNKKIIKYKELEQVLKTI
jgi:hypothetical protein